MKKLILLLCCVVGVKAMFAQTINDPNAQVRDAKNFHAINLSSAFDVYLSQGNEEGVAVSAADPKDRDRITVDVKNGVLSIGLESGTWKWKGNKQLKAYISFKTLDKLNASGACDIIVKGTITGDNLQVHMSGASDLKEARIDVKKLAVDISGASDIRLSGTANQVDIEASGASEFKGDDLVSDICNARASGASDIRITVTKELSASASGASDIKYRGGGMIKEIKTSGASGIRKI